MVRTGILMAAAMASMLLATAAHASTADHSKFKVLQQEFDSGPEVTKVASAHAVDRVSLHDF